MNDHDEIPDTVVVDGAAIEDTVFLLRLMEEFLMHSDEAGALVAHYRHPTSPEKLADWVGCTAAYLNRRLLGIGQ
jgi:hypothetical protein